MAKPGAIFTHDIPEGHNVMVFVYEGEMHAGDKVIAAHQLGVFLQQSGALELRAGSKRLAALSWQ